jgi:hypothetical protein
LFRIASDVKTEQAQLRRVASVLHVGAYGGPMNFGDFVKQTVLLLLVVGGASYILYDRIRSEVLAGVEKQVRALESELQKKNGAAIKEIQDSADARFNAWLERVSSIREQYKPRLDKACAGSTSGHISECIRMRNELDRQIAAQSPIKAK